MTGETDGSPVGQFGMVGLGVMGRNLALNIESRGYPVAVWDRVPEWIDGFLEGEGRERQIVGSVSLEEFVGMLQRPRRIMMMVKAGDPVDWTIGQLTPHLQQGDILIDGGNSHFEDTRRREKMLGSLGLHFLGTGVSGGEAGARHGPSLMPGGSQQAYQQVEPVLQAIAAQVDDGPCVHYCGPDGAGHFVKMVHNGIEYGDMQLIAEAYHILRELLGLKAAQLADVFAEWNRGVLDSYLIEITAKIFTVLDEETGRPLVDLILDKAGQKGTGRWTAQLALELGVPIPTIQAAIEARLLSAAKEERMQASRLLDGPSLDLDGADREEMIRDVHDALYVSKICSYAQGFALIAKGSDQYEWGIDLAETARIWKGGCIIRARLLERIQQAYRRQSKLRNLLLDPEFSAMVTEAQTRWRRCIGAAQQAGIPVLAMASSLAYFDSYRSERLPQNLTQAQRDFFGAHRYQRVDQSKLESIHTDWD